uniref:Uncharacterized protein n=1 Tax=Arcella intermedia TaxID=1963864 RepID=A0A6B2LQ47_9EUKA
MDRSGYDHFYKLLICGDSAVGKSCFLLRLIEGKFYSDVMTTIGIDFKTIQAYTHQHVIKLQIWDTAGQERFSTLTDAYYRGSQGVILMFDVSNRATFNNIQLWHKKTMQHAPLCALLLMGNKGMYLRRRVCLEE